MKALVMTAVKELTYQEVDEPVVGPEDVLIRVRAVGICGSDVHGYAGISGRRVPPIIMGHEVAGDIVQIGSEVSRLKVGDRVAVDPVIPCGECRFCRSGATNLCENRKVLGVSAGVNTRLGGMAEFLSVPARIVTALPDNVSYEEGALLDPLAVSLHAVKRLPNIKEQEIGVIGLGPIGLMAILAAQALGAAKILAVDVRPDRLQMAADLGAVTVNAAQEDMVRAARECTQDRGLDGVVEAAGAAETVSQSLGMVKAGGTVVVVGLSAPQAAIDLHRLVGQEITLRGTYTFTSEYQEALDLVASGRINLKPLVSVRMPLAEGWDAFRRLEKSEPDLFKVILEP